jgi:hypothetical protein
MATRNSFGASELEREFELEMEDTTRFDEAGEDPALEFDETPDQELSPNESLAERLAGLASKEFESEFELDEQVNQAFDDVQEQFLGKALRRVGRRFMKAAPGLLKRVGGLNGLKGLLPVDLLKKSLAAAAKGVMASNPALAALAPAIAPTLKSLGIGEAEYGEPSDEVWQNFETLTERAYEYLVENLSEEAAQPLAAIQLAGKSLQHGINSGRSAAARASGGSRRRVIKVRGGRPGDELVIRFM